MKLRWLFPTSFLFLLIFFGPQFDPGPDPNALLFRNSSSINRAPAVAGNINPEGDEWKSLVVGKINEIPNPAIRKFLELSHFNNPFATTISTQLKGMGPFSPQKDTVFWIPTIDIPVKESEWRFLSSTANIPQNLKKNCFYKKGGQYFLRMFVHPFTTANSGFSKLAKEHGGFKYEFQGSTTASVRSLVAWRTRSPRGPKNLNTIDFPKSSEDLLWPKVSIHSTDINGSRMNPAKKMVRAHGVTELMGAIPESTKKKMGFNFAGEWVVGVPDGTDAGFVVREILPEYAGRNGLHAEPAFSVLSTKRLTELTKNIKNPDEWIREKLVRPLAKSMAYLFMEEGMLGEFHTQNFSYVVDEKGIPTGKLLFHDADAFRTSLELRTLLGKETAPLRNLENPFFFMKDAAFIQKGGPNTEGFNLNGLVWDMVANPDDSSSLANFLKRWARVTKKKTDLSSNAKARDLFLDTFAEELSPYLKRKVTASELSFTGMHGGNVGLVKLFDERLKLAANRFRSEHKAQPKLQKVLLDEFSRLNKQGFAKTHVNVISLESSELVLIAEDGNAFIAVMAKNTKTGSNPVQGIALLGPLNDSATEVFAAKVSKLSGISHRALFGKFSKNAIMDTPIINDLGGGNIGGNKFVRCIVGKFSKETRALATSPRH